MRRLTEKDEARFWADVLLPDSEGHMWWTGTTCGEPPNDYGTFRAFSMGWRANRVSLFLAEGYPPSRRHQAAHAPVVCHQPRCVAPAHLRWATPTENAQDKHLDGTAYPTRGAQRRSAAISRGGVGPTTLALLLASMCIPQVARYQRVTRKVGLWLGRASRSLRRAHRDAAG